MTGGEVQAQGDTRPAEPTTSSLPFGSFSTARFAVVVPVPSERSALARYAFAFGATLLSLAVTLPLASVLERVIFVLFWPAVIAAAWFGGIGPAIFASALSIVLADFFLIGPPGTLALGSPEDLIPLAAFLFASSAVALLTNTARTAQRVAAEAATKNAELAHEIELQAIELEQQLEESQALSEELEQSSEELAERTAAAESAELFTKGILDSISHPFVVHDAQWRFRFINDAAAAEFRSSPRASHEPPIGRVLWDVYPDIIGTVFEREMRRAATERRAVSFEAFYPARGVWSSLSCFPMPDGGLATQWIDITARKRAEETDHYLALATEVLSSSLDYETTLEQLAQLVVPKLADWCAVHLVDDDGTPRQLAVAHVDPSKVEWAHELARRYPPRLDSPTGVPNVLRTRRPDIYPDITDDMLVAGAVDDEHLRISRELGLKSALVIPLLAGERAIGALTLVSAESGRRYTEDDLPLATELARRAAIAVEHAQLLRSEHSAREAAEEANRAKTQFLATMSHELRTPLNAISGYAELLSLGLRGPTTPEQQEDLSRIMRSQRHLLSVINDILNFARLEAGHVEYHVADVPVADLLTDLESLIRPQLVAKELTFSCESVSKDIVARADEEKVRQVLLNLLANAVKFTSAGGSIRVDCDHDESRVYIRVADTGIGIPRDRRSAIFEPFVQLHRTLAQPAEGTGLGLAISRDLARGMGGELTVESEPGQGALFTLALDRAG
jgi:signal transduction histidine kinase/PAS domain-containing protein